MSCFSTFFDLAYWVLVAPVVGQMEREVVAERGVASLAALFRWKVNNPLLIAATAVIGLLAYPILQPDWVMVK